MMNILRTRLIAGKLLIIPIFALLLSACQLTEKSQEEFDPERAALARLKLGLAYLDQADQGEDNVKLAHYNLSLANQYSPYNPNVMLGMALFDQYVGENTEAEMIYKKIIEMDPNNGLYVIHYGTFLCANRRYEEAKPYYYRAAELDKKHWKADALEQLGYCAIQNSDKREANTAFKTLFNYDMNKRTSVRKTGEMYLKQGAKEVGHYLITISEK